MTGTGPADDDGRAPRPSPLAMAHDAASGGLTIVFVGLTITSSWGNGHATTYRALVRELARAGHDVTFLEQDVPWYAAHRDLPRLDGARVELYRDADDLRERFAADVSGADAVVVGSYVPDGDAVGAWVRGVAGGVRAFYDIDTPVTLAALADGTCTYLAAESVAAYDLYLSFAGGRALETLERRYGSPMARPLYCSVDVERYRPLAAERHWLLGYMGTYSHDRQGPLEALLLRPAQARRRDRFVVAGPQYPDDLLWPDNVERLEHVAPDEHARFFAAQRFTLNVTRAAMRRLGHAPSVRLFEAAACGVPIIGDRWPGLEEFLEPGEQILVADDGDEVLAHLAMREDEAAEIGRRARARVVAEHSARRRAEQLIDAVREAG